MRVLKIKIVDRLKDTVQRVLDQGCRAFRVVQPSQHLRQFADGRHADFIPVEKRFLQTGKALVGHVRTRILQATRVEQLLQHRTFDRLDRLVVLGQHLLGVGNDVSAFGCRHRNLNFSRWKPTVLPGPPTELSGPVHLDVRYRNRVIRRSVLYARRDCSADVVGRIGVIGHSSAESECSSGKTSLRISATLKAFLMPLSRTNCRRGV